MKKVFALMMALVMLLSLAACGNSGGSQEPPASGGSSDSGGSSAPADGETKPAGDPVVWKWACNLLEDTDGARAMVAMFDRWTEETNGEVTVEAYYQGALGSEADVIQNIQTGNIQVAQLSYSLLAQFNPAWTVMDLPFMFSGVEHYNRFMATDEAKAMLQSFQNDGIWVNYAGVQGFRNINTTKKLCKTVEDFKGLIIRAMDNASQLGAVEALGGIGITMPYADCYNGLNTGVCDGWIPIYTGMSEISAPEVAPYVTECNMIASAAGIIISQKALDALSPSAKETVMRIYDEMMPGIMETMYDEDQQYKKTWVEEGKIEVYEVEDLAPYVEAVAPVWEKIAAQFDGVSEMIEVVNSVR